MTQAKFNKNPDRRQMSNLDGTIDGNIFTVLVHLYLELGDCLPNGDGDGINGV